MENFIWYNLWQDIKLKLLLIGTIVTSAGQPGDGTEDQRFEPEQSRKPEKPVIFVGEKTRTTEKKNFTTSLCHFGGICCIVIVNAYVIIY